MSDFNNCYFLGRIASSIKRGKTLNGEPFIAFLLNCEPTANANSSENNRNQYISIRCFKPKVIKYVEKVGAHRYSPVCVIGFVSSYQDEVKGKRITANSVNANQILVIQTRPYDTDVNDDDKNKK